MDNLKTHLDVNEQLYSRQLYVLGRDAMRRLRGSSMLVSGMKGLGVEIAKNLVLAGVGSLTLHDPSPTCWMDLASQFFLSEKDIGQKRAEASLAPLAQLNSDVRVSTYEGPLTETVLQGFQVVVLTDSTLDEQLRVGSLCHQHGVCFLVASTRGLVGQLFCDFGEKFTIHDPSEAEPLGNNIRHISQGSPGILTVLEETGHGFQDGDWVSFSGIEGMTELNDCDPRPIRVRDKWTLEIGDTTAFSPYLRSGVITEVRKPQTYSYEALSSSLDHPRIVAASPPEAQRAHCLHWAFQALHKYQAQTGCLPRPWHLGDADKLVVLAQGLEPLQGDDGRKPNEPLDETLVREFAMTSSGDLSPINSVLGGMAAQEMLKAASGKFKPLNQWLYFDALECLPEDGKLLTPEACAPRDCRYDGQIAVFGDDFQKKLGKQRYFLVGAGAIGCELLKTFAMLGLGAGQGGGITVTDMDTVELSNLNRQFLFRSQDLHKSKSEAAAQAVRSMNPALSVTAHTNELGPDTERIYGDDFFSSLHGVASAVDSFQARNYVSKCCVHYLKPMLESGTQGTKGSASIFVPFLTQPYGATSEDAVETAYPLCTLRNFPSTTEHTLQWARNEFEGLFRLPAETITRYLQEPGFLKEMEQPQALDYLKTASTSFRSPPQCWRDCVAWARGRWQHCFHDSITHLLRSFPPDKVNEEGVRFWLGTKLCPQPLEFDISRDAHLDYILATANLYAKTHKLPGSQDRDELRGILQELPAPAFELQAHGPVFADDQELLQASATWDPTHLQELCSALERWRGIPLEPQLFEKDDDSNFHMDFIVAASNLRANNYGIPPADRNKSKKIIGKIIPAIATTTAVVAGLVGLELYKVVMGHQRLSSYRHSYLHLATPHLSRWIPMAPSVQKYRDMRWTSWDRLTVPAPAPGQPEMTLKDLLTYLQENHGLPVTMLLLDSPRHLDSPRLLYSRRWPEVQQNLQLRVTELVHKVTGQEPKADQKELVFEVSCEDEEEDTIFPPVHYRLRSGAPKSLIKPLTKP